MVCANTYLKRDVLLERPGESSVGNEVAAAVDKSILPAEGGAGEDLAEAVHRAVAAGKTMAVAQWEVEAESGWGEVATNVDSRMAVPVERLEGHPIRQLVLLQKELESIALDHPSLKGVEEELVVVPPSERPLFPVPEPSMVLLIEKRCHLLRLWKIECREDFS